MKIKICGITNLEDARLCESLNADFIGFIFAEHSPRKVSIESAAWISNHIECGIKRVGVFTSEDLDFIKRAANLARLDVIQLHAEQSDFFAKSLKDELGIEVWRAVHLSSEDDLQRAGKLSCDVLLVDSRDRYGFGGTGKLSDWAMASILSKERRLALAGGIAPSNALAALNEVRPWCLDVNSGVEIWKGKKSPKKLEKLFKEIR